MIKICTMLLFVSAAMMNLRAETTPEEMTFIYFEAFKKGDMEAIADQMHENELMKFKQTLLPVIEKNLEKDPIGAGREAAAMRQFIGKDDLETVREESPKGFFVRFMNWMLKLNPLMSKTMAGATIETLGHVTEKDMAHVIYRINIEVMTTKVSQLKVMSVRKQDEEWRLMMTGEIEGLGKLLQMNPNL